MELTDFKALTFDVYGTLIDWETGIINGLTPLTDKVGSLTRNQILEAHAHHESTTQYYTPSKTYSDLLAVVYKRLSEEWKIPACWEDCLTYGMSVRNWPAFDDSAEALTYLKQHYKLVVLSNVDNASFAHSIKTLGVEFDAAYTAGDIGSYKPADRNFDYMLENLNRMGIKRNEVLHTAESMFHDHGPANRCGLANCRIYRRHDKKGFGATMHPGEIPSCNFVFHSMAEMVENHREKLGI